jgi:hypothetical protein
VDDEMEDTVPVKSQEAKSRRRVSITIRRMRWRKLLQEKVRRSKWTRSKYYNQKSSDLFSSFLALVRFKFVKNMVPKCRMVKFIVPRNRVVKKSWFPGVG